MLIDKMLIFLINFLSLKSNVKLFLKFIEMKFVFVFCTINQSIN